MQKKTRSQKFDTHIHRSRANCKIWQLLKLLAIQYNMYLYSVLYFYYLSDFRFLVRVSYLEIYNEEVRDLLSKDQSQRLEVSVTIDKPNR